MKQWHCTNCHHEFDYDVYAPGAVEVACEDCGSHPAIECPKCNEISDAILKVYCIEHPESASLRQLGKS